MFLKAERNVLIIYKGFSKAADEFNIPVYGATFDCDDITNEYMKDGNLLCTFDQNMEGTAKAIVDAVNKLSSGTKVDENINSGGILLTK